MRRVRRIKRILTFFICLMISVNMICTDYVAYAYGVGVNSVEKNVEYTADNIHNSENVTANVGDIEVKANNSVGALFESELSDELYQQEEVWDYNIFSVEMIDTVAVVEFEAIKDCTIVVGIYNEDNNQLLMSGTLDVYAEETLAYVDIDTDAMPEYYYVRAYLVTVDTLQPLSREYESPMYTKEMQEFLTKTTDDFEQEKVLNFDEDKTNNFAVYSNDTKLIGQSLDDRNKVTYIDDETKTYVIENADEDILSLVEGEVFSYQYSDDEVLIVKVDTITIDGTTVTITGVDTTLEEVFDYVKIDEEASADQCETDEEYDEEGVVYNGIVEMPEDIQTYVSHEGSKKFGFSYSFIDKLIVGTEDGSQAKFNGNLDVGVTFAAKVYISLDEAYFEFTTDVEMEINISVSGKITTDGIPLKSIKNTVGFFDAVTFSCKPKFVVKAEGELSLKGNLKATVGFRVSTKTGITSLNTTPKMSLKSELEVTIFVGLVLGPEVKVKNGDIAEGKIKGEIGVEINANHTKLDVDEEYGEKKHPCKFCVDGDLIYKRSIVITTKVGDIEELEYNKEYKREFKFADWYYSIDKGKFGLGECPYITYRIIVQAIDEKEKGLPGVTVFEDYVTGEDGRVTFYLPNGYYDANPTKDGYIYIPTTFLGKTKVNSKAKNLTFLMVPENGGSEDSGEGNVGGNTGEEDDPDVDAPIPTDNVVIDETTFPDENFRQFVLDEVDINEDGILSKGEIEDTITMDCSWHSISNLKGIEYFVCLETLDCYYNDIVSLDVSNNICLKNLDCDNNDLTTLDVSGNENLEMLSCDGNQLTALDVTNNVNLIKLYCARNYNLTSLDVSNNSLLEILLCTNNKLGVLDVSNNLNLTCLHCYNIKLKSLDVSNNTNLVSLYCGYNDLSSLDVSNNVILLQLKCGDNNLSTLDVGYNVDLEVLECESNNLTALDIRNNLSLKTLDCGDNKLNTLDVSNNEDLNELYCYTNNLSSLDVSNNSYLYKLSFVKNKISNIDLSKNEFLQELRCYSNNLTTIDVSTCEALVSLACDNGVKVIGYEGEVVTYSLNSVSANSQSEKQTDLSLGSNVSNELQIMEEPTELTYQSATTSPTKTIHQVTTADDNHIDYTDLYPNEIYNLYVVKESADGIPFGEDVLTSDNLLYIRQYTSDGNGELSIDYLPIEEYEEANEILVCSKRRDISEGYDIRISNLIYTGEEQAPTIEVKYGDELLTEGRDYELEGDFYVTDVGDYTISIKGIGIYEGSVDIGYSVLAPVVNVESIKLTTTELSLKKGDNQIITYTVSPSDATDKTLTWSSSDETVATVDSTGKVTALKAGTTTITATANDGSGVSASCTVTVTEPDVEEPDEPTTEEPTPDNQTPEEPDTPKTYPAINISYRTHIQSYGWEGNATDIKTWKSNGTMSGTSGKAKRLEGINIVVNSAEADKDVDLGIQYTTHCQSYGWLPWSADGDMNGTEGEAKRLEAIKIQLTGADKDAYDVYYRVHAQSYGWLGWAKNGEPSGTASYAKRLEGIQIVVVKKGEDFNQKMEGITSARTESYIAKEGSSPIVNYPATSNTKPVIPGADTPNVSYRTHVQSFGWQGWKYNGQMSGTSGLAKRLEGININLTNKPYDGDIVYTTHVQRYGWKDGKPEDITRATWKKNGQMSGTSGEAKRLEAICIDLTGEMAEHYDIYYRVHAQTFGWLGWAKNGEESGTAGYAKRLEGIQIVLVPKGGAAPASNYGGVISKDSRPFVEK